MCLREVCDNRDSVIGILTRLLAGEPDVRGPISGRGKRFFPSPKCSR
jgi:hypothetical protein